MLPISLLGECADHLINVEPILFLKIEPTPKIDMPPGNGRNMLEHLSLFVSFCFYCYIIKVGKDISVAKDDAVGNKPRAFTPDMLLKLRSDPKFPWLS